MKYAHIEQERRFLLRELPGGVYDGPERRIHDRYVEGTRLRLRLVEQRGAPPVYKLGQKVRFAGRSPLAVAHTTVYLDATEFTLLARLPAAEVWKTRRNLAVAGCSLSIDVFHRRLGGLVLAETEHPVPSPARLMAELGAVADITEDDRFSGGSLATTSPEQLRDVLAEYGGAVSD